MFVVKILNVDWSIGCDKLSVIEALSHLKIWNLCFIAMFTKSIFCMRVNFIFDFVTRGQLEFPINQLLRG